MASTGRQMVSAGSMLSVTRNWLASVDSSMAVDVNLMALTGSLIAVADS